MSLNLIPDALVYQYFINTNLVLTNKRYYNILLYKYDEIAENIDIENWYNEMLIAISRRRILTVNYLASIISNSFQKNNQLGSYNNIFNKAIKKNNYKIINILLKNKLYNKLENYFELAIKYKNEYLIKYIIKSLKYGQSKYLDYIFMYDLDKNLINILLAKETTECKFYQLKDLIRIINENNIIYLKYKICNTNAFADFKKYKTYLVKYAISKNRSNEMIDLLNRI
jgi:hypothetical protein